MTVQAFLGLVAFVAVYTVAGLGVVAAIRGRTPARGLVPDLGLAYALGVAALGTVLTIEVIAGIPLSLASILVTAAAVLAGGLAIGRRHVAAGPAPIAPAGRVELALAAVLVGATVVVLEAVFRAARLEGLFGWDAGSFWVPKAEVVYYTGGIDAFHFGSLSGPSYPPFLAVVQASAFHLGGTVDVIALHLVHWSFLVAFVAAAARLLAPVARPALAWAGVLAVVVADQLANQSANPQADVLMDLLLGLAVVCLARWLLEHDRGLFAGAIVFLSAAVLVKREGLLVAACLAVALLVAEARRLRASWPYLVAVIGVPLLVSAPWRVWLERHSFAGNGPEEGPLGLLDRLDRLLPSLKLVVSTGGDPRLWSVVAAIALLAIGAALLAGERRVSVFALTFAVLACLGFTWVMWSFPSLPLTKVGALNPIPRLVGSAIVPLGLLAPVLLTVALSGSRILATRVDGGTLRPRVAVAIVAVAALGYPAAVLAFDGVPRFPSRSDCAVLADPPADGQFLAVYQHTSSLAQALESRDKLLSMGFVGAEVRPDGCGRWKVANPTVVTVEQAQGHAEDAARAGYALRLEAT